jgi:hypothetical protein
MPDSPSWKQPSVWIPLLMSFAAFALLLDMLPPGASTSRTQMSERRRAFSSCCLLGSFQ